MGSPRPVRLPWIQLDLDAAWPSEQVSRQLEAAAHVVAAFFSSTARSVVLGRTVADPDQLVAIYCCYRNESSGSWPQASTPSTFRAGPSCRNASLPVSRTAGPGRQSQTGCPLSKSATHFGTAPHGWGKYPRFCLDHEIARIGFSTSCRPPNRALRSRAEFLHSVGPEAAIRNVRRPAQSELGRLRFWVNRVDLFADWQGWSLGLDDAPASCAGRTPDGPTKWLAP